MNRTAFSIQHAAAAADAAAGSQFEASRYSFQLARAKLQVGRQRMLQPKVLGALHWVNHHGKTN